MALGNEKCVGRLSMWQTGSSMNSSTRFVLKSSPVGTVPQLYAIASSISYFSNFDSTYSLNAVYVGQLSH